MAGHQHDHIVYQFLEEGGVIVYLSDDAVFTRALRNIISRDIGFKGDATFPFSSPGPAMDKCLELRDNNVPTVVFIERQLANRPTTDFVITLKRDFPGVRMIMLTWEVTQETVAYLFELGVNRVLVKPASADKVIEELAATINPPGELKKQMTRCAELLENGDFDEALEVTDRILMLKPDSARGLAMRGDALMGIGDTDQAVQSYMAAHESKPIFMAPLAKLAEAFKAMEDERALDYMKELDELSPLNPERKVDIAEQHLRRNEREEAEAYLDKGVEMAERESVSMAGSLTERIVDAVSNVAPNLAVKYLKRVLEAKRELGRDDMAHFNRLGIILRNEGKWREAVDVYQKALTIVQNDPVIHYNLGLAYWEGNERTRALCSFEKALDINPHFYEGSIGAALNIGSLYLDLRQFTDAEPFFEHVIALDPEHKTAQKRLQEAHDRIAPTARRRTGTQDDEGSASSYDMDALVGGPKVASRKKPSSGGSAYNMDSMFSTSSMKKRKKKKSSSGKSVDLNF